MKMNKKLIIAVAGIMILLLSIPAILLSQSYSEPSIDRTLTKAICNSRNYCEDYNIACKNNNVVSIKPTGYAVKFSPTWKDPREEKDIKNLC